MKMIDGSKPLRAYLEFEDGTLIGILVNEYTCQVEVRPEEFTRFDVTMVGIDMEVVRDLDTGEFPNKAIGRVIRFIKGRKKDAKITD